MQPSDQILGYPYPGMAPHQRTSAQGVETSEHSGHCLNGPLMLRELLQYPSVGTMNPRVAATALICVLTGCGSFVPVVKLDQLPAHKRHAANSVEILNATQLQSRKFRVLTVVEGHSCQNKLYDPPATRSAAIDQIKYYASEAGANAVSNIQCGGREGTSIRTNCLELISCTAEAIRTE